MDSSYAFDDVVCETPLHCSIGVFFFWYSGHRFRLFHSPHLRWGINGLVHLVLSDIKVFGKSDLDSFNKSNANFDFDKYDEEFDTKCYEDDDNIYDSDLMDRGCIRFILLPYFELRKKLLTMKVDDIEKTIEENKETITQIEKQASDEASAISAEHKKLIQKAPEGTIIDMNWNSVYELERKRIALETENKFLLFFHNKVHS